MSDSKPQNDPSMDDILASIRKIISDDEARAAAGPGLASSAPPQRPMQPAPARAEPAKPAAAPSSDDDVLLLTDLIDEPQPERSGPRPVVSEATIVEARPAMRVVDDPQPAAPSIAPIPSPAKPAVMDINEPQPAVVSPSRPVTPPPPSPVTAMPASPPPPARETGSKVSAAFDRLNRVAADLEPRPDLPAAATPTAASGKSVDDLVREMLRPMLQEWMDKNLPDMIERFVERAVEREIERHTRR